MESQNQESEFYSQASLDAKQSVACVTVCEDKISAFSY